MNTDDLAIVSSSRQRHSDLVTSGEHDGTAAARMRLGGADCQHRKDIGRQFWSRGRNRLRQSVATVSEDYPA